MTSNRGRAITIEREDGRPDGRIIKITDPRGNAVRYDYDTKGNLIAVTDRADNSPTRFKYYDNPAHYLKEVIAPNGTVLQTANYTADGRLNTVTDPRGGTATITSNPTTRTQTLQIGTGVSSVTYDDKGRVSERVDAGGHRTVIGYDAQGNPSSEVEIVGQPDTPQNGETDDRVTSYVYDSRGLTREMTDALGNKTSFQHTTTGQIAAIVDSKGNPVSFGYDDRGEFADGTPRPGNLTTMTETGGRESTFDRDAAGNITQHSRAGRATSFTFDPTGDLATTDDGSAPVRSFDRDANGNLESFSYNWVNPNNPGDVRPVSVTAIFDENDQVVSTTSQDGVETSEYDILGNEIARVTPDGRMEMRHDALGDEVQVVYPDGTVAETVFDAEGRVVWSTTAHRPQDPAFASRFMYNNLGQILTEARYADVVIAIHQQADGTHRPELVSSAATPLWTRTTVYGPDGNVASYTNEAGLTTNYTYDELDRQTRTEQQVGALSIRVDTVYDANGRILLTRDALGRETRYEYNDLGQQTKVTYPDGASISQTFTEFGEVATTTNELGRVTEYAYDGAGNLAEVRLPAVYDPVTGTTRQAVYEYDYDTEHHRTLIRDPYGHEQRFELDQYGRQTAWVLANPSGTGTVSETRTYDAAGRPKTVTDFKGQVTAYSYDSLGRMKKEEYFQSFANYQAGVVADSVTYNYDVYDAEGRHAQVIDARGTTDALYDGEGRLVRVAAPEGTVEYDYNAIGQLAGMNTDQTSVTYGYDLRGLLTSITTSKQRGQTLSQPQTTYAYNAVGALTQTTLSNGLTTVHGYDARDRVQSVETRTAGGQLLDAYYYLRDAGGKVTTVVNDLSATQVQVILVAGTLNQQDRVEYGYDAADRLVSEQYFGAGAATPNRATTYVPDLVGNVRTKTTVIGGTTEQTQSSYNVGDQLTEAVFSINGVTQHTTLYQYDANGSLVQESRPGETTTNVYNLQNRQVRSTVVQAGPGGTVTQQADHTYDADGIRTSQTVVRTDSSGTTTTTTKYVLDKLSPYGHPRVIEERNAAGNVLVGYLHGSQPIAQYRAEGDRWYLSDRHSGVRHLANSSGIVTDGYLYDAFGNLLSSTGTSPNTLLYRGEHLDGPTGYYYLRARHFDPATGRFTQMDPWSGDAGRPITLNKYLYADGDPVRYSDPTGLMSGGEMLSVISIGATRATIELKGREMAEKQVDAAWLGKFFLDFMAINMYYTWQDEPELRDELIRVEPYIIAMSKGVMNNAAKRYANMDTKKKLKTLGRYVAGMFVPIALSKFDIIHLKGNGQPAFAHRAMWMPGTKKGAITVIKLTGSYDDDYRRSNTKTGFGPTVEGHNKHYNKTTTWHHHEVIGIMILVKSYLHNRPLGGVPHEGGVLFWEIATGKEYGKTKGSTKK